MTSARFILVLAASLCPALLAGAADLAMNENPYTPIVTRNIFGLVPIPTNTPVDPASLIPPPKITPNGIMTIFGQKEALFKVTVPGKPGKPAQDQSYTMSEGESQDDIEVTKIDDQADVVTFNNHGVIQELPLVAAPDLSTPVPAGNPGVPSPGGMGGRFGRAMGGGGPGFAGRRGLAAPNAENPTPTTAAQPYASGPTSAGANNSSEMDGLSPEAQALLIEAQRSEWQSKPDTSPNPFILPPTPLTEQNGPGGGSPDGPGAPEVPMVPGR